MNIRPEIPNCPERSAPRAIVPEPFQTAVFLASGEEKVCGNVLNISTSGLYVENKARFPKESEVVLESMVWEGESRYCITLRGWVARTDEDGMGIQFADPDPAMARLLQQLVNRYKGQTSGE